MAAQNSNKHRAKGRSNSVDTRKPRVATPEKILAQAAWRNNALMQRVLEGRVTAKNEKEIAGLGLNII